MTSTIENSDPLVLIASLKPGLTLSTSSMQIVDHKIWSTSFSRTFARDNRRKTVDTIKEILNSNINKPGFSEAVNGYSSLMSTYEGDYLLVAEIENDCNNYRQSLELNKVKTEIIPIVSKKSNHRRQRRR